MDFWRAYRLLARRKWVILAAVLLTTGLTALGALTKMKAYDAYTSFGPTEYAVRKAVSVSLTDERNQPLITEDNWSAEARRVAGAVVSPEILLGALQSLKTSQNLRSNLSTVVGDSESQQLLQSVDSLAAVRKGVGEALAKMTDEQKAAVVNGTYTPIANWAMFIYLGNKLDEYAEGRLFLTGDRDVTEAWAERLWKDVEDGRIEAKPVDYRTVQLMVRDKNPRIAEILATAITSTYKVSYDSDATQASQRLITFYEKQEIAAKRNYNDAQEKLRVFRSSNPRSFMADQVASAIKVHEQAKNSLEEVNASLRDLDAQIIASRARLAGIPRMLTHTKQEENPRVARLRDQINALSVELADKEGTYTADHPDVKRLKERIASLQENLRSVQGTMLENKTITENPEWEEREREIAGLVQRRQGLAARVATLNGVINEKQGIIGSLPNAQTTNDNLMRNYGNASERLTETTRKLNQAKDDLTRAENGSLQIKHLAGTQGNSMPPESPAHVGTTKTQMGLIALAFLLSLLGSAAVILGLDFMDTSVKTPVDVQRMLDMPVNGIVPRLSGAERALMPTITHSLPASPHAESYRFLGTDLLLTAAEEPFKTVMVATAKPNQGGTATICNLAITLAQAGQSVVLVDADLRRPSLHNIFKLSNDVGLSNVLNNGKMPSDALQRTDVDNLYVMTGGPAPDNAWQLLRSPKMRETIADLARDFDFVLFDTPSAVVFADAATIATMVDGVLLVVRANEAPSGSEMQVKNLLNKTKARIVGVVLNDMPVEQVDSARYFTHYYDHDGKGEKAVAAGSAARPALPNRPSDDEI